MTGHGAARSLVTLARQHAPALLLAAAYALVMSLFCLWAHEGLRTQMDDLGNMAQALWGASRGDWLMTQSNDLDGVLRSRLGVHTNLIFWALAPLYALHPDPRLLLVLTSVACAAAGLGLYAFARHRGLGRRLALLPAVAFWLSPLVHDANLYDFHVVTLLAALLVWMIWAFESGRRTAGWILLVLALLCQEHAPLLTAAYGAYQALTGRRRQGLLLMGVSAAYLLFALGVLAPLVNRGVTISKISGADNRYRWIVERPGQLLATCLQPERLRLIAVFLLAGAIASLRQWRFLLLLVPSVLGGLLAGGFWMSRVTGTYYFVVDAAAICLACTLAASTPGPRRSAWPLFYAAVASAALSMVLSPLPYSLTSGWANHDRQPRARALAEVMREVPADAALVVQNNLGPHLAHRAQISRFPRRLAQSQYAVFHLRQVGGPDSGLFVRPDLQFLAGMRAPALVRTVEQFLRSKQWTLLRQTEGFYLFRRGAGPAPSEEVWAAFRRDAAVLLAQDLAAEQARRPWARYLAGPWRWSARSD